MKLLSKKVLLLLPSHTYGCLAAVLPPFSLSLLFLFDPGESWCSASLVGLGQSVPRKHQEQVAGEGAETDTPSFSNIQPLGPFNSYHPHPNGYQLIPPPCHCCYTPVFLPALTASLFLALLFLSDMILLLAWFPLVLYIP